MLLSSADVYGAPPGSRLPLGEGAPLLAAADCSLTGDLVELERLADHAGRTGLDVTVLRPSVIFGAEDKFLNTFASLQKMLPFIPLAGSTARFQPVWVEDVASAIVKCIEDRSTIGQTFEACGPDVFTLKQLVQLAGQYSGHDKPVIGLPDGLARIQAALMELAPGEPIMSRDNLDAMKVDNVASGKLAGLEALGITPAAVSAVVPFYLGNQGLRSGLMAKRKTAGRF